MHNAKIMSQNCTTAAWAAGKDASGIAGGDADTVSEKCCR